MSRALGNVPVGAWHPHIFLEVTFLLDIFRVILPLNQFSSVVKYKIKTIYLLPKWLASCFVNRIFFCKIISMTQQVRTVFSRAICLYTKLSTSFYRSFRTHGSGSDWYCQIIIISTQVCTLYREVRRPIVKPFAASC